MSRKVMCVLIAAFFLFSTASAFAEGLKFGYVDGRKIFYEYKKTKDFQKDLEAKDEEAKKEFDKKTEEIRKLRDEIDLLSEKAKEKKQEELMQKTRDLNDFRRTKGEELIGWRDNKVREINKDITDIATAFAKKNGYDILFNQMAFVYSSEKMNVTEELLKELNK